MKYGVDVALRRADDLDKQMLADVATRVAFGESPTVLDIGCGGGGQSRRLAVCGAHVTALDIDNYSDTFIGCEGVAFAQADIAHWLLSSEKCFDIVCFQRTLHYLPYDEAKVLLISLKSRTKGTLYLSVTGATSAIAKAHLLLDAPLPDRFGVLLAEAQAIFSITAPLCIYHHDELLALLQETGWRIVSSRVSDFGNSKVVAVPA